ncbi:MAG: acyl-CoA thioesterase [Polynucleobacter sp.]|jgi:acyl-CoA thioester hydrolase
MRIDIPENKKKIHETIISIRWGDMDSYRHINNTVYFRYMEQARIEWITSLGFSCTAEKEAMIMVNGFCNFYKQVSFPASLRVSTFVGQIGNSTVDLINTMDLIETSTGQEPVLCAAGGATMLWVDLEKNKSMPWPESILKVLR